MNWGVELLQSSALPLGYGTIWSRAAPKIGASDEARTRYLHLGKVALYQMSYTRRLPGEKFSLQGFLVPPAGIEPATRGFSVPCSTD